MIPCLQMNLGNTAECFYSIPHIPRQFVKLDSSCLFNCPRFYHTL